MCPVLLYHDVIVIHVHVINMHMYVHKLDYHYTQSMLTDRLI